ncbi:MAG: hypothetical protein R6V45_04020, partial [Oceanipulchritudo sp.]
MPSVLPLVAVATGALTSMWRIELLHPAVIHFPIVLTLLGGLFWILGHARALETFRVPAVVTLILAAAGAWLAVQTGFWADAEAGRDLYDPRPLKDHENLGFTFALLMSGIAVVELLRLLGIFPGRIAGWTRLGVGLALMAAA